MALLRERVREADKQALLLARSHKANDSKDKQSGPEWVNVRHSTGSLPKASYHQYLDDYESSPPAPHHKGRSQPAPEIGVAGLSNAKVRQIE